MQIFMNGAEIGDFTLTFGNVTGAIGGYVYQGYNYEKTV
jgi:hypothetical protein